MPELIGSTEGEGKAKLAAEGSAPHHKLSLSRQEEDKSRKNSVRPPCGFGTLLRLPATA